MMYAALILVIMSFTSQLVLASQNHFKNQLLGRCPETQLSFTSSDNLRVTEGSGVLNLGISLTKKACTDMQVEYGYYVTSGTVIGTHVSSAVSGIVTIPKGQKTATISFSILQNAVSETEKAVFISLRGGKNTKQKINLKANSVKGILIADDESTYGTVAAVATSGSSICILIDGVLKCWGDDSNGTVGNGATSGFMTTPKTVNAGTSFSAVAMSGGGTACAITTSGVLKCWGSNFNGSVGDGTTANKTSPTTIASGTLYSEISTGVYHTCGITTANVLTCWGNNAQGQLGDGTTSATATTTPKVINSGTTYAKVAAGGYSDGSSYMHTCAITTSGELQCWGRNNNGQVGNNTLTNQLTPVTIDSGVSYTVVRAGGVHNCAITTSGVLKCWGDNSKGQIGDGTLIDKLIPTEIDPGQTYLDVDLGDLYTCAITTSNKLKCWGENTYFNLGNRSNVNERSPVAIDTTENYVSLSAAGGTVNSAQSSACGVTTTGRLKCWGSNNGHMVLDSKGVYGDIGISEANSGLTFASVSVGGHSACGLTPNQDLYCWGANTSGQLGDRTVIPRDSAVLVDPGVKYAMIDIAGGTSMVAPWYPHTCGITTTGVLKCWGSNSEYQLGNGTTVQKIKPTVIDAGTTYSYVATGYSNTCAITTAGVLKCWGDNSKGQLGIGSTVDQSTPTVVASGTTYSVVDVSEAYNNWNYHTCAITTAGEMQCWGSNNQGQLGNGTTAAMVNAPVAIDTAETYAMVTIGGGFLQGYTCGLTTGNKIKCWGNNSYGVLGVGDTTQRTSPTPVDAANDYAKISSKGEVSCAVTTTGQLRCWGYNFYSMVGDGTTTNRSSPVNIDAGKTYVDVGVGHEAGSRSGICGIEASTLKLRCWGYSTYGSVITSPKIIGAPMFIPQVQQNP